MIRKSMLLVSAAIVVSATPAAATALAGGSGATASIGGDTTASVEPIRAPTDPASPEVLGNADDAAQTGTTARDTDIVVTGERAPSIARGGTKTDTPVLETPQSITVISGAEIAGLGLQNLNQSLRTVAGITPETRGASAEVYDQFKLRGFDAPVYLDGLRMPNSASGYAAPQVDVSRLDRVEVLKGPASALYGSSTPGGLIDQTSKLPLDRAVYGAVAASYGTFDLYRIDADIGGTVAPGIGLRVYGSANGTDTQQTYGKRERQTISVAGTAGMGGATTLTLLANWSHDPFNGNYGVFPASGTLIANGNGRIPTEFYGGEPGDFFRREQFSGSYVLTHRFGGDWAFRASGRYYNVRSALGIVYTSGAPADFNYADPAPRLFARASYATDERLQQYTFDNQLTGKVATGAVNHSLLFGVDRQLFRSGEVAQFGGGTPIDAYAPVYGTMPTPKTPGEVTGGFGLANYATRQVQTGVYAQDQIAAGALRVQLAGRYDRATTSQVSTYGNSAKKDEKFTGRVGALYVTDMGLSPYVSYATSFEPQPSTLATGGLADPSIGKGFEAGVKYQLPGTDFVATAAYFHIEQTNVLVFDPVSFAATQSGKVRSKGFEVEASGSLPYGFRTRAAFSTQDVSVLEDATAARVGYSLPTVGRGGYSVNVEWSPPASMAAGAANGLVIGGAVRHQNSSYADVYGNGMRYDTPGYTVWDALARYEFGDAVPGLRGLNIGVNATNLTDKKYLTSCFANYGWCWYGNRRTVQGTVGFRF